MNSMFNGMMTACLFVLLFEIVRYLSSSVADAAIFRELLPRELVMWSLYNVD